jgi:hypothetical protein
VAALKEKEIYTFKTKTEIVNGSRVEYCAGTGTEIKDRSRGYKIRDRYYNTRTWKCPECGNWYALDNQNRLNKHGRKKVKALSVCADCGDLIFDELHYLCETCRA